MNRVLFATVAAAALAIPLAASSASAEIVDVTYTGTVLGGTDATGVFGLAYGADNMDGLAYTVRYVFDTTVGEVISSAGANSVTGGSLYSFPSPALSATMTVNNVTVSIGVANYQGVLSAYNQVSCCSQTSGQDAVAAYYNGDAGGIYTLNSLSSSIHSNTANMPASITTPFTYTVNPETDYSIQDFQFYTYNNNDDTLDVYAEGEYQAATVTLSAGVPEPSTWALMLAGFAGLGFAMYRERRQAMAIA